MCKLIGHAGSMPVTFPVFSGFHVVFAYKLKDIMSKILHWKFFTVATDHPFQGAGGTGLGIQGSNALASRRQGQKFTLPTRFSSLPGCGPASSGTQEIKQGGVKLHLFPAQPHVLAADGELEKSAISRA